MEVTKPKHCQLVLSQRNKVPFGLLVFWSFHVSKASVENLSPILKLLF